jgi:hypothetical protein
LADLVAVVVDGDDRAGRRGAAQARAFVVGHVAVLERALDRALVIHRTTDRRLGLEPFGYPVRVVITLCCLGNRKARPGQ